MNSAILYLFNSFVLLTLLSACSAGAGLPPPVPTQTTLPAATPTFPAQTPVPSTRLQPTLGPVVTLSPEEAPACRVLDSILPAVAKPMSAIPPVDMSTDHVSGATNPKITIVEYSDFQCPYCEQLSGSLSGFLETNKDTVRFVYRQFPLTSIHDKSLLAVQASEAANLQGKFWEMHDFLFLAASWNTWADMTVDNFKKYLVENAGSIAGLDTVRFAADLDSQKVKKIAQDATDASNNLASVESNGLGGTPSIYAVTSDGRVYQMPPYTNTIDGFLGLINLNENRYKQCPPLVDPNKEYTATIKTVKGDIRIKLLPKSAPLAVSSFVFLAQKGY